MKIASLAMVLALIAFPVRAEVPAEMTIASFDVYEAPLTAEDKAHASLMIDDPGLGTVIAVARQLVALGEVLYPLIKRGQPEVTTQFAPINVLPIDPATGRNADPFMIERTGRPVSKKFIGSVKNLMGVEVVRLEFLTHFSPGGSFEGKGKYVQNAMIVPTKIWASWGWDVTATMRLLSVANQGSRSQPIAAAVLQMNYSVRNLVNHLEKNHLVEINGLGEMNLLQ